MEAVLVVVEAEKNVHDKQLGDRIGQIEQLGGHEKTAQIASMYFSVAAN